MQLEWIKELTSDGVNLITGVVKRSSDIVGNNIQNRLLHFIRSDVKEAGLITPTKAGTGSITGIVKRSPDIVGNNYITQ